MWLLLKFFCTEERTWKEQMQKEEQLSEQLLGVGHN
jgi:hypothetical protein